MRGAYRPNNEKFNPTVKFTTSQRQQNPFGTVVPQCQDFFLFSFNDGTDPNVRPTLIINSQIIDILCVYSVRFTIIFINR